MYKAWSLTYGMKETNKLLFYGLEQYTQKGCREKELGSISPLSPNNNHTFT
jgi:hypothetical protein